MATTFTSPVFPFDLNGSYLNYLKSAHTHRMFIKLYWNDILSLGSNFLFLRRVPFES